MNRQNHFTFGAHGQHNAWTEGDDVVHIGWHGDVTAEDIAAGARAFDLVPNREKGFYLVIYVAEQGKFPPEARRAIAGDPRSGWVRDVIVVGASFHVRVTMGMVTKALYALGIGKSGTIFVASEPDISRQLDEFRKKWQGKR